MQVKLELKKIMLNASISENRQMEASYEDGNKDMVLSLDGLVE